VPNRVSPVKPASEGSGARNVANHQRVIGPIGGFFREQFIVWLRHWKWVWFLWQFEGCKSYDYEWEHHREQFIVWLRHWKWAW
jgi:hypothetical protein